MLPARYLTSCFREIGVILGIKVGLLLSGTSSQTLDSGKILQRQVDRRKCCQVRSTDDRWQFITPCIYICAQYHERDTARRVGLSVWYFGVVVASLVALTK